MDNSYIFILLLCLVLTFLSIFLIWIVWIFDWKLIFIHRWTCYYTIHSQELMILLMKFPLFLPGNFFEICHFYYFFSIIILKVTDIGHIMMMIIFFIVIEPDELHFGPVKSFNINIFLCFWLNWIIIWLNSWSIDAIIISVWLNVI